MARTVAWFSCGAASAVAAKLAIENHPDTQVVYCDTRSSEHPDNSRFLYDVEQWLGQPITIIKSTAYGSVDDVFEETRYMAGIRGARCTVEMKKVPRFGYQRPDDLHIFGYTAEEWKRVKQLKDGNPELNMEWILGRFMFSKEDCLKHLTKVGIKLPVMYSLGFKNNNCIGCVKATSPEYWNKVKFFFPEVFEKRARQSRDIGARLVRVKGARMFLDEMPYNPWTDEITEELSCGPHCGAPEETTET